MGSRFTEDVDLMEIFLRVIKKKELFFFDSLTSNNSKGEQVAKKLALPYVKRDVFIDHVPSQSSIKASLQQLELLSKRNGFSIAIGHPRKKTLKVLSPWLKTLKQRGFKLVPLSKIIERRFPRQKE